MGETIRDVRSSIAIPAELGLILAYCLQVRGDLLLS
jgi:hypothetical protein